MSATLVKELQAHLNALGRALVVDGKYGPKTHQANLDALPEATAPLPPVQGFTGIIPVQWLPTANMARIIVHWTAGQHKANSTDLQHYHILIEGDGKPVRGNPSIKLNESPLKSGYAAHTANCNTGSIGVALCGMVNAVENPFSPGPAPLTEPQWKNAILALAQIATAYMIPVTPQTLLSHAEVQANLGIAQKGKWDIAILPFDQTFNTAKKVGDRMRGEILAL